MLNKILCFFLFVISVAYCENTPLTLQDDFELLLGKKTVTWEHVKDKNDFDAIEKFRTIYNQNKNFIHTSKTSYKIPRIIHFIWLGPKSFPRESVENLRTWVAQHPDWTIKFWTDRDRPCPSSGMVKVIIKNYPFTELKDYYDKSDNWGEKSDILRYEILRHEGGIYIDHDGNCLQPFDALCREYHFFSCLEVPHPEISGHVISAGIGLIGSCPNHPVIDRTIDILKERWKEVRELYPLDNSNHRIRRVLNGTYISLTFALHDSLNQEGYRDIVFPASYFFANFGLPSFYSKHFFGNTWLSHLVESNFQQEAKSQVTQIDKKIFRQAQFQWGAILLFGIGLLIICRRRKVE